MRGLMLLACLTFVLTDALGEEPIVLSLGDETLVAHSVAFSPDGSLIAAGCSDSTIRVWDNATTKEVRTIKGHEGKVLDVAFASGSKRIASVSSDGTARVWLARPGKQLEVLKDNKSNTEVWRVAFDPSTNQITTGDSAGLISFWRDGKRERSFETISADNGGPAGVGGLAFSPDGKLISSGFQFEVGIWNAATGKGGPTLRDITPKRVIGGNDPDPGIGHFNFVLSVAFSPDGKFLASSSVDATIRVWDVESQTEFRTLRGHGPSPVSTVAFSPNGKFLASGSNGQYRGVKIWRFRTGKEVKALNAGNFKGDEVTRVAFSPDGKRLAVATEGSVKLWDVSDLK